MNEPEQHQPTEHDISDKTIERLQLLENLYGAMYDTPSYNSNCKCYRCVRINEDMKKLFWYKK